MPILRAISLDDSAATIYIVGVPISTHDTLEYGSRVFGDLVPVPLQLAIERLGVLVLENSVSTAKISMEVLIETGWPHTKAIATTLLSWAQLKQGDPGRSQHTNAGAADTKPSLRGRSSSDVGQHYEDGKYQVIEVVPGGGPSHGAEEKKTAVIKAMYVGSRFNTADGSEVVA